MRNVQNYVINNEGIKSSIIATLLTLFQDEIGRGYEYCKSLFWAQFTTTVAIKSDNRLYEIIDDFLIAHPESRKTNQFSAQIQNNIYLTEEEMWQFEEMEPNFDLNSRKIEEKVIVRPHKNFYHIKHKGNIIFIRKEIPIRKKESGPSEPTIDDSECSTLYLSFLGKKNENKIYKFLDEITKDKLQDTDRPTKIYVADGGHWRTVATKKMRSIESVILPENFTEEILEDAKVFLDSTLWYTDMGIPHRRGYLFHGPPGTGKSSIVQAVAGKLGLDIYILRLSNTKINDDVLENLMSNVPSRSILLIEDVDRAFPSVDAKIDSKFKLSSHLTFSGLLQCLDGLSTGDGRILCLTTNHPEKLDPALIRPGRVDKKFLLGYCTMTQVIKLFSRFYPKYIHDSKLEEFASKIESMNLTMAQLQEYFLNHRDMPEDAIKNQDKIMEKISYLEVEQKILENNEEEEEDQDRYYGHDLYPPLYKANKATTRKANIKKRVSN